MKRILLLFTILFFTASSGIGNAMMLVCGDRPPAAAGGCSGGYDYTLEGASTTYLVQYEIRLERVTIDCSGTVESITAWLMDADTSAREVIYVLYDDDGTAGEPSTLLYNSSAAFFDAGSAADHIEITDTGISQSLTAGDYWVGVYFENSISVAYDASVGQSRKDVQTDFQISSIPDPWPHATDTHSTSRVSFYMSF